MKFAKLLVLSALWLTATSAVAAIADVREKPVPSATQGFASSESTDTYYYLYNVGAKAFFTEGNAWGTQASVGTTGLKVAFVPEDDYYLFNDYSVAKAAWKQVFFDSETAMFVDWNNQNNYYWGVEENGETFRLFASDANPGFDSQDAETGEATTLPAYREGQYVGLDAANGGTALSPYLTVADGHYVEWALVTEEVYAAYEGAAKAYDAALTLKATLEEAEAIGASVAEQLAVYNNTASTVEELNDANTAAKAAIEKRKAELVDEQYDKATVENPVVVTDKFIKNPAFVGDDLTTGWSGDAFGSYGPKENAEHYNKTYDTYQKLTGLKEGVYAVGVKAFYRAGDASTALKNFIEQTAASKYAKLYATSGGSTREVSIVSACSPQLTEGAGVGSESNAVYTNEETGEETPTYYFPNNMEAAEYYMHTLGYYDNKVLVSVGEDGELTIGVKKSSTVSGDWSIFDDFSLTYYGSGADAYQLYLDEMLKNYEDVEFEEGTVYTQKYVDDYRAALKADQAATTKEEVIARLDAITDGYNLIQKNIDLWKQWQSAVEAAKTNYVLVERYQELLAMDDLSDYCEADYEEILDAHKLTNEELEAEIDKLAKMIETLIEESKNSLKPDTDVTDYLTNPGFDEGTETGEYTIEHRFPGWTGTLQRGNGNPRVTASCAEFWNCTQFDCYQDLTNLPKGVYEISVQGFYRYLRGANAWNAFLQNDVYTTKETVPVYIYMNDKATPFTNVFNDPQREELQTSTDIYGEHTDYASAEDPSTGTTYYFPDNMPSSSDCFREGMYTQSAFGLVAQDGETLRVGVKGSSNQGGDSWVIFDNFKLTYRGFQADVVKPRLEEAIEDLSAQDKMAKDVAAKVAEVKAAAEAVVNGTDGEAMFKALSNIYAVLGEIEASKALFAQLQADNEALYEAIANSSAAESVKTAATDLYTEINDGLDAGNLTNEDAEKYIGQIPPMKTRLAFKGDPATASDDNAIDCTAAIVNPDYVDSNDGWSGTTAARNADATDVEIFGSNFDYYQDIVGLPAGTYQVQVQGFYRAGTSAVDYSTYLEDAEANNNAFIYASAINGTDTITSSAPITRLAAEAGSEWAGSDGFVNVVEATDEADAIAVANTMTTAGYEFESGKYADNVVTVKVSEGDVLRIGLKKEVNITDNWTIWNSWTLTYFGTNSSKTADGDPSAIAATTAEDGKVEFFSLSGAQLSQPGKGVVLMKRTLTDGTVKVQKVIVK